MAKLFARVVSGAVVEIIELPDDLLPEDAFRPEIASALVAAAEGIEIGQTYRDGAFGPAPPSDEPTAQLLAYAANKRWAVETGGITVGGSRIDTSRESQNMISNANAYVQASGVDHVTYKALSGWVALDAATVTATALAVGAHVQTCFTIERALDAGINAKPPTITTTAEIDAAAWPS